MLIAFVVVVVLADHQTAYFQNITFLSLSVRDASWLGSLLCCFGSVLHMYLSDDLCFEMWLELQLLSQSLCCTARVSFTVADSRVGLTLIFRVRVSPALAISSLKFPPHSPNSQLLYSLLLARNKVFLLKL